MGMVYPDTPATAVQMALVALHFRAQQVGRKLHPIEVVWFIRHTFRVRHPLVDVGVIERFADLVIYEAAKLCEET